ncbi:MAG: ABC-2 family transporter protein [Spirochaetes bacterium]|nr:ABC-2 family transporter protein [Spirochaetota bacterium]
MKKFWQPYLAAFRGRAKASLQYRSAALAGMFTQFFFGLILTMVMEAWYQSYTGSAPLPLSLHQAASYIWLGQMVFALIPWRGDPELQNLVRSGEVGRDLVRPVHIFSLWFIRSLAWRYVSVVLRFLPILIFSALILPHTALRSIALMPPASTVGLFGFLVLLSTGSLLSAAISVLISCFQFRQISAVGMNAIAAAIISFFSGQIVPLPLISGPVELIYRLLPFRYMADVPYRFWLGSLTLADLPAALTAQFLWLAILLVGGHFYVNIQLRQVTIAGG